MWWLLTACTGTSPPQDTDAVTPVDGSPSADPQPVFGHVHHEAWNHGQYGASYFVHARFFDTPADDPSNRPASLVASTEGPDRCELLVGAEAWEIWPELTSAAGDMELEVGEETFIVESMANITSQPGEYRIFFSFNAEQGTAPSVALTGDVFQGFDAVTLPPLPARFSDMSQWDTFKQSVDELSFTWQLDGELDRPVRFDLTFGHATGYFIECVLENDGQFTVPDELVDQVVGDFSYVGWLFFTEEREVIELEDGRGIEVRARTSAEPSFDPFQP